MKKESFFFITFLCALDTHNYVKNNTGSTSNNLESYNQFFVTYIQEHGFIVLF